MESKSILKKLRKIFKKGYIPSRGYESYEYIPTKFYLPVGQLGNCFTHACFNLKNEHYEKYKISKSEFESLRNLDTYGGSIEDIRKELFDFVSKAGLTFEKCEPDTPVKPNQWKVAYYFDIGDWPDFHFLLQEKNGTWNDKISTTNHMNFYSSAPNRIYHTNESDYYLQGFYIITNPYAKTKLEPEKTKC